MTEPREDPPEPPGYVPWRARRTDPTSADHNGSSRNGSRSNGRGPHGSHPYSPPAGPAQPRGPAQRRGPVEHPRAGTALVVSIVSLAACPPVGLLGLLMGRRARREIDAEPSRYTGRRMATAAYVIGWVSLLVSVFYLVIGLNLAGVLSP